MAGEESGAGYPEEQPSEVGDGEDTPQREGGRAGRRTSGAENEDEGTATGNPHNAGADEGD
jgi:hypothetical protein